MKTHVIRLEPNDDLVSAGDRLAWCKLGRVLMVWPDHSRFLRNRLDLVLLQRQAAHQGAQLAVVASDEEIRLLALELGIPVFQSILQAQHLPWRKPRHALRKTWRFPPSTRRKSAELRRMLGNRWQVNRERQQERILAGALILTAVLGLALFFLPYARIRLPIQGEVQNLVLEVRASPEITAPHISGGLPAQTVRVVIERNERIPSTGRLSWPLTAAAGEVLLTNLTEMAIVVNPGTVVLTTGETPVRFRTTKAVEVPAGFGRSVIAPVMAEQPGSKGNVRSGQIQAVEGSVGSRISVTNQNPASGGSDQNSSTPSDEDESRLRETLLEEMKSAAAAEMVRQLGSDKMLMPVSVKVGNIQEEKRWPEKGQPADWLEFSIRTEYSAWYINRADLLQVAKLALDAGLPAGYATHDDMDLMQQSPPFFSGQEIRWMVWSNRNIYPTWSEVDLKQTLSGRKPVEAVQILQSKIRLRAAPEIHMVPNWWPRLPWVVSRIFLEPVWDSGSGEG